jgi:ribosomal protein S18 acetylase RimI-like enzyme
VNVRLARLDDAQRLAEIHVETWRATYPGVMPKEVLDGLSIDDRRRQWEQWIPDPRSTAYVAERSGEVVGFVNVGPCFSSPELGQLYAIYVVPHAQGSGAGPALMSAALAALAERFDEAILWVATENPRARRFYEREGWSEDGERVDDSIPGVTLPETRYRVSGLARR